MAAMKLLLSQARRHCLARPHSSPFYSFHRYLSSSSDSNSDPNSNPNPPRSQSPRTSVPIEPVSYSIKPKDQTQTAPNETPTPPQQTQQQQLPRRSRGSSDSVSEEIRTNWTREDIRYVKDVPSISPVSYPTRVAPLPEDRDSLSAQDGERGADEATNNENVKESERRRIEAENRARRRVFRFAAEEEKVAVPFPLLIKPEKKQEKKPVLDLMEAIKEVKANAMANFDETVEAHVRLGIERGRSELIVRGTLALPHSTKKDVTVAVFAEGADAEEARAAGADIVGGVELIEEIMSSGKVNFDRCFSTPKIMQRVYKISRILNHHGLMPNPKQGTVTKDVARAVKEAKQGHSKFRMDKTSIVHVPLGKVSFTEEALRENVGAFMNALLQAKPAGLKKTSKYAGYVNAFHLCSTMGPGFPVSIQSLSRAADHFSKVQQLN